MNFRIHVAVVAALAAVLPAAGLADEPIARCTVQRPTGSYSLVKLHFDVPGAKEIDEDYARWTLMGGLRGDAMLVPHGIGLGTPGGQLTLTDEKLSGTFDHCPKPGKRGGKVVRVVVNATVSDNKVSGTATIGEHDGKVTGTITPEAELAKANDVPADVGWPSLLGPVAGGAAAESTPVELVDDPKNIRLVWAPEETDIGQGVGSISRFMDKWRDASQRRTCSGSTSPVAANGRVYLSYFVPTPAEAPSEKAIEKLAEGSDLSSDKLPWYALEKIYPKSDDVVLCMDAETGKTLWKATVSARGRNHQHHKEGPFDMTPGVGGGRVFAIGMSGYLYAFDAETGKPLWEQPLKNGHRSLYSSTALPGRKVVVVPLQGKWAGFDVKTGKLAWHSDIRHEHVTLALYPVGDKDYFIGGSGDRIVCLDGADGKVVWSVDAKALSHGRGLGCGGISIYGDHMIAYLQEGDNRKDHKPHCAAWRIDGAKTPAMLWKTSVEGSNAEHVPVIVRERYVFTGNLACIDLTTGRLLAKTEGIKPGNGGYMQAMADTVLVRRDGTHGDIQIALYRLREQGQITKVTPGETMWRPSFGGTTSSYHHMLMYPLLDGRIYLRQKQGVFCWDMRKPK